MLIALSVKNKSGFMHGTITKPDSNDGVLLQSWIRNNNMVISWILNSVSKHISASIFFQNLQLRFGLISETDFNRVMD